MTKQIRTFHIANIHNKINWGWEEEEEGKSNVQIRKINTLFIWIFYKIAFKTKSLLINFASMCKLKVVSFFFLCKICSKIFLWYWKKCLKTLKCINRTTTLAKKKSQKKSTVFITTYKNTRAKKKISGKCILRALLHLCY